MEKAVFMSPPDEGSNPSISTKY